MPFLSQNANHGRQVSKNRKNILLQNRTALFPDHTPAENGGAKCPINCDTYSPGALIHNNFLMIIDYFLPLSTKLNKVEIDIYLNKTKAFGAIAPSSVAFHKRLEHNKLAKKVKERK